MRNRDKWIAIAFLVFIFTLPLATVVQNIMPQTEKQLTDEEKAILENNGTSVGGSAPEENETQPGAVAPDAAVHESAFTKL